jgi:hypothetical protein
LSIALVALALAQATPAPQVPPSLLFGFYRMVAFHQRAADLKCEGPDRKAADDEFDSIRKRLIARYGKQPFSPPRPGPSGPGDCRAVMMVYQTNLAEYRKLVDSALAAQPAPGE